MSIRVRVIFVGTTLTACAMLLLLRTGEAQPAQERVDFEEALDIAHDESPPLRDIPLLPPESAAPREFWLGRFHAETSGPSAPDTVLQTTTQTTTGPLVATTPGLNSEGVG